MLSSSATTDWQRINPFLTDSEVKDILQLTAHAMLRAVRVVLANGSLAEARDLQKMLTKAISTVKETGKLLGCSSKFHCDVDGLRFKTPQALGTNLHPPLTLSPKP